MKSKPCVGHQVKVALAISAGALTLLTKMIQKGNKMRRAKIINNALDKTVSVMFMILLFFTLVIVVHPLFTDRFIENGKQNDDNGDKQRRRRGNA